MNGLPLATYLTLGGPLAGAERPRRQQHAGGVKRRQLPKPREGEAPVSATAFEIAAIEPPSSSAYGR